MSQEKRLAKNTIIYAIGNFGSKILGYIMVLVYSYFLHTDELGYYDLILTTISMVQPLVLFQINDSMYRFMLDKEYVKSSIIATTFRFIRNAIVISIIIFVPIAVVFDIKYIIYIILYYASLMMLAGTQDAIRGYSKTKLYAGLGILNSGITLAFEFFGLVVLHKGIEILLISKAVANIICVLLSFVKTPILKDYLSEKTDRNILNKMLIYSIPLVPNVICWWIMNSSDRYIIRLFIDVSANGIYAISNKFPTIITTLTGVFYLAWQESAIKEYEKPNRDAFFSGIFNKYFCLLMTLSMILIPVTKVIILMFVAIEYKSSWEYTPSLYIAVVFSALCSFLGIGYQISKETIKSFYTTIISAFVNIMVNISLINIIGIHAASISTLVAYIVLFLIRIYHTRKYYKISYDYKRMLLLCFLCLLSVACVFIIDNVLILVLVSLILLCFSFIFNRDIIRPIIRKIRK